MAYTPNMESPRIVAESSEQSAELDDSHHVELKSFLPATCVSKPLGCCSMCILILAAMAGFGYLIYLDPVCLSFNFTDFKVIDSDISNDFYQHSLSEATSYGEVKSVDDESTRRRLTANRRQLQDGNTVSGYYMGWTADDWSRRAVARVYLNVFFYSKKTSNILSEELLELCHEVEVGIKDFEGYHSRALLYKERDSNVIAAFGSDASALHLEAAPGSFLNYIYPQTISGSYVFNGNGDDMTLQGGIEETIRAYSSLEDLTDYFDFGFDFINVSSNYLAAVFPFSYKYANGTQESGDELREWVSTYKDKFFDKLPSSITDHVGVAVSDSANLILNDELYFYLGEDLQLAGWSLLMIFVVVYLYCRSLYITFFGLLGVCSSFVPCFALYRMVWGESFNLVNMVSVWVILGIGCDDICVFMSSYRRAPLESVDGAVIPNHLRMAFAYREAGAAMFVTSFTTACSFFSLCLSTINPLPQFGWFLGALVLSNFVLVMTWFPCVLQSYVWFVMLTMKCHCHIDACNRWLAVAVPLPHAHSKAVSRANSVKVMRRVSVKSPSHRSDDSHSYPVADNEADYRHQQRASNRSPPVFRGRHDSMQFAVPGSPSPGTDVRRENSASRKLMRTLTERLEQNKKAGSGGFEAETHFGDATNLYFIIMRRGLGMTLIGIVAVLTVAFSYTMTNVAIAEETTKLLPEYTNWGLVNMAINNMDINEEEFSGYSASTRESSGAIVVSNTKDPTRSPVFPSPTQSPTAPTVSPSRGPTAQPVTTQNPTAPTDVPTANPSTPPTTGSPSSSPTKSPSSPPSGYPTPSPSDATSSPSTATPTKSPSPGPTAQPITGHPTPQPTDHPVAPADPTSSPTGNTVSPTKSPSRPPTTYQPTVPPSKSPSGAPTRSPTTAEPTSSPTTFAPTTSQPTTSAPTTFAPTTHSPTTDAPTTAMPTTSRPTTQSPTAVPTAATADPSLSPTASPTFSPTYSLPVDPVYSCFNEDTIYQQIKTGDQMVCTLERLMDTDGQPTALDTDQIAFVFESGSWLYGSNDITGCSVSNNDSMWYDDSIYVSDDGHSVKWCFSESSSDASAVNELDFELLAPFSSPNPSWFRLSMWLYYNEMWQIVANDQGDDWYNYSIVSGYSATASSLSVDESVPVILLFGTQSVTEYSTDCDGEVTSGTVSYDKAFDLYAEATQLRWLDLCDKLDSITDTVMYRRDDDQDLCFGRVFAEYIGNATNSSFPVPGQRALNRHLSNFVELSSANSFSSADYSPSDFQKWFGTAEYKQWTESSEIAWIKQRVQTQINKNWGGAAIYEYYQKWEEFIADFNAESSAEFKGIQTASAYIRMEVEVAFLEGFVKSVMYTIILCSAVMVCFTQNFYLVFLVCIYILIICVWIVGLFGAMGWPFSIIEIISVPTVVGLTIDYALHITHAYVHSPFPDRLRRAKSAVNDLGSSIFASAMTTVSSMFILYFAVIVIFSDLGWVVGVTTTFGVMLALFVCPPCLMYTGPQYDQCHFTWFCPHSMNGIKIGKHRFCSNQWHGEKREVAELAAVELQVRNQKDLRIEAMHGGNEGVDVRVASNGQQIASSPMDAEEDSKSLQRIRAEQERIMQQIAQSRQGYSTTGPTAGNGTKMADIETSVSIDYDPNA